MRKFERDASVSITNFDSFHEAIEYCHNKRYEAQQSTALTYTGGGYHEYQTYDEAYKVACSGWPEGRAKAKAIADKLDISSHVVRPEIYFTEVGDGGFDIGKVVSGEPECMMDWRDTEEISEQGNIVRIAINLFASSMVDKSIMIRKGAAICAMIDALEAAGKRVELTAILATATDFDYSEYKRVSGEPASQITIPLKAINEAMQIDQIAFCIGNPDMFRRFGLLAISLNGIHGRKQRSTGGYPADLVMPEVDIYIKSSSGDDAHFASEEAVIKWATEQLHKFGIKLDTDK